MDPKLNHFLEQRRALIERASQAARTVETLEGEARAAGAEIGTAKAPQGAVRDPGPALRQCVDKAEELRSALEDVTGRVDACKSAIRKEEASIQDLIRLGIVAAATLAAFGLVTWWLHWILGVAAAGFVAVKTYKLLFE
ncbi:MAG: hypothetical protein H6837_16720 [Planctomycetes bacterium]|nr:hypothetical protein [Planctomycetota bacterium]